MVSRPAGHGVPAMPATSVKLRTMVPCRSLDMVWELAGQYVYILL